MDFTCAVLCAFHERELDDIHNQTPGFHIRVAIRMKNKIQISAQRFAYGIPDKQTHYSIGSAKVTINQLTYSLDLGLLGNVGVLALESGDMSYL